ncbi:MAG: chemotaxis protein CheD [Deltaproteobacteria bacterium]|nr:chemotaxis protein CheD [Deltaproteobacteria bacterium]
MKGREVQLIDYLLLPGHIYLTQEATRLSTVLGSCVAVTLWDSKKEYGGMAHFLYPFIGDRKKATAEYGNVAVKYLVETFLDNGSKEKALRAQIFGGAFSSSVDGVKVARENVNTARKILRTYRIKIISEDIAGNMGRKIVYNTHSNEAIVYKVNKLRSGDWYPYVNEGR